MAIGKIKLVLRPEPRGGKPDGESSNEGAFRALIRTYGLVRRAAEPYFAQYGISGSQWAVLRVLHRAESESLKSLRVTELGDRLLVRAPSVTSVVDRLMRMGLVARDASTTDLRARQVSLTAAGRQMARKILQNHPRHIKMILGGLSLRQQEELRLLLEQLAGQLETALARREERSAAI